MTIEALRGAYQQLRHEGTQLAGGLGDLRQRATVYHHLFAASGGNHIFPLIAAHGALWARGWFAFGKRLGGLLACQYGWNLARRREQLQQLEEFANAFRDVNRRVCVETYASFHFTRRFGRHAGVDALIRPALLDALNQLHNAAGAPKQFTDAQRRDVFLAHFLDEQEHVVGPSVAAACHSLDWPLLKWIGMRPVIRFAYFPKGRRLWFRDFSDVSQRITNGLAAFDMAAEVGWKQVEAALSAYDVLPAEFFASPPKYFESVKLAALSGG